MKGSFFFSYSLDGEETAGAMEVPKEEVDTFLIPTSMDLALVRALVQLKTTFARLLISKPLFLNLITKPTVSLIALIH